MKPNLTFVEDNNNRQAVIYWKNVENNWEYVKFRQFNAPTSTVNFFMNWEIEEVQKQIKKILETNE